MPSGDNDTSSSRPSSKGYHPAPGCNESSPPRSSVNSRSKEPAERNSRSCCFCWCCCCSCSCLTIRNTITKEKKSGSVELPEEEYKYTFEELTNWGTSFENMMKAKAGQKLFAEFLQSEYSDENILFWQACEDLKHEEAPEKILEKARLIYEDFISILSPKEVSLDSRVREIINTNMLHPSEHTFDEAQLQVFTLMHRDSYPRFVNSSMYRNLLRQAELEKQVPLLHMQQLQHQQQHPQQQQQQQQQQPVVKQPTQVHPLEHKFPHRQKNHQMTTPNSSHAPITEL